MMGLIEAVQNRDSKYLQAMSSEPVTREIPESAKQVFNELFRQLKAVFPALLTSIKTQEDLNELRKQWVLAFAENGITTIEQVNAGMKIARQQDLPFLPAPGQFVKWCQQGQNVLGVTIEDVMSEFRKYCRDKDLYDDVESFPWSHPVMYWIVPETRRAMYQRCLNEPDVEKLATKKINEWAKKVSNGEQIPQPVKTIAYSEPVQVKKPSGDDHKFRYMPNCTMLGAVTPAQWLQREFERRKSVGIIKS